jgi:integrase
MTRHQRGYIFEASNAFHVRYYAICDGERKQLSHRLCTKDRDTGCGSPSAKAVRQLCEDFLRTVNTDEPTPSNMTVVEFWDTIYLPFIEGNLKHSTLVGYKSIWATRLKAHFGNTKLKDYRTPMASAFLTSFAKTLRPRSLSHIKALGSAIFMHAVNTGNAESNPWRDCKVLGKTLPNGVTQSYTLEDIENVISALVDHVDCQLIMALSYFSGLRKSEIQGLQWGDVDQDYIHIRRAIVRGAVGTPKTALSASAVPLIGPVRILLALWRGKSTSALWVFPNREGGPTDLKNTASRVIVPALEKACIPWKGFHAGRRGIGTKMRELTGNSNAGKELLRHSTTQITEGHYEARMPEEALKGMRLLEAVTKT